MAATSTSTASNVTTHTADNKNNTTCNSNGHSNSNHERDEGSSNGKGNESCDEGLGLNFFPQRTEEIEKADVEEMKEVSKEPEWIVGSKAPQSLMLDLRQGPVSRVNEGRARTRVLQL
jgi:hypothetical protein